MKAHASAESWTRTVYYEDECVRSPQFGLGVVVGRGADPWVSFLSGLEVSVDGGTLVIVPEAAYKEEEHNRAAIERWLTWRLTGQREPAPLPTPAVASDLAERMVRPDKYFATVPPETISPGVLYFQDAD